MLPLAAVVSLAQQPSAAPHASTVTNGAEKIVTEAENGAAVTLNAGEVLVVRLKENPSTGYSRALVSFPDMPVRLISHQMLAPAPVGGVPVVGAPRIAEWKFVPTGEAKFGRTVWLKLLRLRPFAKGMDDANLWEIKVNVPPTPTQ